MLEYLSLASIVVICHAAKAGVQIFHTCAVMQSFHSAIEEEKRCFSTDGRKTGHLGQYSAQSNGTG